MKYLFEIHNDKMKDIKVPLTVYYAREHEYEDEKNANRIDETISSKYQERDGTRKTISGNKFYKPISRLINE